jgi:undecaprenyl diphosphate synthase
MRLLESYLVEERAELLENDIRLRSIGRVGELPPRILAALRETERLTREKRGMVLRLALNYGGRQEILDAMRGIAEDVAAGRVGPQDSEAFGESWLRHYLYDPAMSDPDLVVRTAGEQRLSNFLLWHSSYSEIWVTPKLWPDFDVAELIVGIHEFARRERKFGAVGPGGPSGPTLQPEDSEKPEDQR